MSEIDVTSTTIPLTLENLPPGNLWERDGSCWRAERCDQAVFGREWRWRPMNMKAFAKDGPEGEMTDFYIYLPAQARA